LNLLRGECGRFSRGRGARRGETHARDAGVGTRRECLTSARFYSEESNARKLNLAQARGGGRRTQLADFDRLIGRRPELFRLARGFFGPDFDVAFNRRICLVCASVHILTALPPTSRTSGAVIRPVLIQCCKVARGIPAAAAASTVVKRFGFMVQGSYLTSCHMSTVRVQSRAMGNSKPNRRELSRRRKIREYWAAHPERRKAQSETQKQVWTLQRRGAKSKEQKQYWAAHPERVEAQRRDAKRNMRSRQRRKTNSENMKRLKADPEFEALRLAGILEAKADPEQKERRIATLAKTLARRGVRKRAIRNSKKAQSDDGYRARMSARKKNWWAELRAGSGGGANEARERGRPTGIPPFTQKRLRYIAAIRRLGKPLRQTCLLVYPDAPAPRSAESRCYNLESEYREEVHRLKSQLSQAEAEKILSEPIGEPIR